MYKKRRLEGNLKRIESSAARFRNLWQKKKSSQRERWGDCLQKESQTCRLLTLCKEKGVSAVGYMKPSQTNQRLRQIPPKYRSPGDKRKSTKTEVIRVRKRKYKESCSYYVILASIVFIILPLIFILSKLLRSGGSSPNVQPLFLSLRSLQTVNVGPELDNFVQNIRGFAFPVSHGFRRVWVAR